MCALVRVELSITSLPLTITPPPVVRLIRPSHVDPTITNTFTVRGQHFASPAFCVLGSVTLSAVYFDSHTVQCALRSATLSAGAWAASVTQDVAVTPASPVTLTLSIITVQSISSTFGPDDGGVRLTITGQSFLPRPSVVYCVFDRVASLAASSSPLLWSSPAMFINSTTVTCLTTPHAPANVSVDLMFDNQLSSSSLYFSFTPQLRVLTLTPSSTIATTPTTLTLSFDSSLAALLTLTPLPLCQFGSTSLTPLLILNSTTAQCNTTSRPRHSAITVVDNTVYRDRLASTQGRL